LLFLLVLPPPPSSTLFPYTTLFRSEARWATHRSAARRQCDCEPQPSSHPPRGRRLRRRGTARTATVRIPTGCSPARPRRPPRARSEEHTSELQSQSNLVCRLLLEKK